MLMLLLACAATPGGGDAGDARADAEEEAPTPWTTCEPAEADGLLDLERECAGALCVGMGADEVLAALGEPEVVSVVTHSSDTVELVYQWASGLETGFWDNDHDGEPDAGGVVVNAIMHLPWTGATTTGIGIGASWACFEEAFGLPDYPWAVHEGEADIYVYAEWSDARVWAEDNDNNGLGAESDPGEPDGYVDLLRIWGSERSPPAGHGCRPKIR